jgi:hypothetical protein
VKLEGWPEDIGIASFAKKLHVFEHCSIIQLALSRWHSRSAAVFAVEDV